MNRKNKANKKSTKRTAKGNGSLRVTTKADGSKYYKKTMTYKNAYGESYKKTFCGSSEEICNQKQKDFETVMKLSHHKREVTALGLLIPYYKSKYNANTIVTATYLRKMFTVDIIKNSKIADIPIIKLTAEQINAFLNTVTKYSNSDIAKITTTLSSAYQLAIDEGIVESNLMSSNKIIVPTSDKKDKEIKPFTKENQKKFLEAMKDYKPKGGTRGYYRPQLYIELYTGMRMGEINALTLDDVDLERGTININKTITKNEDYKAVLGVKPKTASSRRIIKIPPNLIKVFEEAINNYTPNKYKLIFIRKDTLEPIHTAAVNNAYKRICENNGIPDYGQHSLRHTYATRYIENMTGSSKSNIYVLSRHLGHKDISTTLNTYAEVLIEYQEEAMLEMYANTEMFDELP